MPINNGLTNIELWEIAIKIKMVIFLQPPTVVYFVQLTMVIIG